MPVLADRGLYTSSGRSFYLVFRAHLSPSAGTSPATTGAQTSATHASRWYESVVELGHHLSPHHQPRDLTVPLSGD
jgi:hypothetical protein